MNPPLTLFRAHREIVSFYLETEWLHSIVRSFVEDFPNIPQSELAGDSAVVLGRIYRCNDQSGDLLQLNTEDALWLFRRAHAQVFPGNLLRNEYASYHDLAYWVAETFTSELQFSNNDQEPHQSIDSTMSAKWPTQISLEGLSKALKSHEHAFDDLQAIQGHLSMEAAAAANISPQSAVESDLPSSNSGDGDLTPRELTIIEALGEKTMPAKELSEAAGYQNNSNFRSTLSNLVKRQKLKKCPDGNGYLRG